MSSTHFTTHTHNQSGSGASVAIHEMPQEEGSELTGRDPIELQLPRRATGSGSAQTSTTPVTCLIDTKSLLQVTPYRGDKASFLSRRWSCLIAVRAISKPLHEGFKKIENNMNQEFQKSRLSNEDLDLADQASTLLALPCKDEACACVRLAEPAIKRGKHERLRTRQTSSTSYRNHPSSHQTRASTFDSGTKV